MTEKLTSNKFFYITFIKDDNYCVVKLINTSTIKAIQTFNKLYTMDCIIINIQSTNKILPDYKEKLITTCHPN